MGADVELIRGTGNVFRDRGREDADAEQLKAPLAALIIACLDRRNLTVRAAGEATGIAAADFARIRRATLDRFTVDRLIPNPIDPFGMADLGMADLALAQAPRGLSDTLSAWIKR